MWFHLLMVATMFLGVNGRSHFTSHYSRAIFPHRLYTKENVFAQANTGDQENTYANWERKGNWEPSFIIENANFYNPYIIPRTGMLQGREGEDLTAPQVSAAFGAIKAMTSIVDTVVDANRPTIDFKPMGDAVQGIKNELGVVTYEIKEVKKVLIDVKDSKKRVEDNLKNLHQSMKNGFHETNEELRQIRHELQLYSDKLVEVGQTLTEELSLNREEINSLGNSLKEAIQFEPESHRDAKNIKYSLFAGYTTTRRGNVVPVWKHAERNGDFEGNPFNSWVPYWFKGNLLVILIHGFTINVRSWKQSMEEISFPKIAEAIAKKYTNSNIVMVNWECLSGYPDKSYYGVAAKFSKYAGEDIGWFLRALRDKNFLEHFGGVFMIGHGLGAHVAGVAGSYIINETKQAVRRIIGLDATGFLFWKGGKPIVDIDDMLDGGDAYQVDAVHCTNNNYKIGDVDILVNDFPECPPNQKECARQKCAEYYLTSITKDWNACPCESEKKFRDNTHRNVGLDLHTSCIVRQNRTYEKIEPTVIEWKVNYVSSFYNSPAECRNPGVLLGELFSAQPTKLVTGAIFYLLPPQLLYNQNYFEYCSPHECYTNNKVDNICFYTHVPPDAKVSGYKCDYAGKMAPQVSVWFWRAVFRIDYVDKLKLNFIVAHTYSHPFQIDCVDLPPKYNCFISEEYRNYHTMDPAQDPLHNNTLQVRCTNPVLLDGPPKELPKRRLWEFGLCP